MPYIKPVDRARLDPKIAALAAEIVEIGREVGGNVAFAGMLNYACTRLALKLIPDRRYWTIALITGVFKNIGDEFYRRYGVPYEDEQIIKNGDVF